MSATVYPHRIGPVDPRNGFSLLELLTVMVIMGILLSLALPFTTSLQETNNLGFAGQMVVDQMAVARQYAASRNQTVYVCFIDPSGSGINGYTSLQLWPSLPSSGGLAVGRAVKLPGGIEISANPALSPLVSTYATTAGTMPASSNVQGTYIYLTVRPDGNLVAPNAPVATALTNMPHFFFTLLPVRFDGNSTLPKNYVTVQINPDTAEAQTFRP